MKRVLVILWAVLVSAGACAGALEDRLMSVLVSPERVLQQAANVQLSAEQEERIRAEINRAQADILKLQSGLLESLEALARSYPNAIIVQVRQDPEQWFEGSSMKFRTYFFCFCVAGLLAVTAP